MAEDGHAQVAGRGEGTAGVIFVVMREHDGARRSPLAAKLVEKAVQPRLLVGIRRSGVDDHELPRADDVDVGVLRRRKGRRDDRKHDDAALEVDARSHLLVIAMSAACDGAPQIVPEPSRDAPRSRPPRCWRGATAADAGGPHLVPSARPAERDSIALARRELSGPHARLVFRRGFDEEDVRIEPSGNEPRRHPPASRMKASAIDGEAVCVEKPLKPGGIRSARRERAPRSVAFGGRDFRAARHGQDPRLLEELSRRAPHERQLVPGIAVGGIDASTEQRHEATEHFELPSTLDHEKVERRVGTLPSTAHEGDNGR